ncbi:tigger transposable element-derived protein 4-like [Acyrthosiphon pisum]|uniref:HTH CENPB-type domain-containing protein n=1 Tax=Acyrthosiphon pisum TaxID=7029 RepID=A0A8R2BAW9_ACYPI|nr:tigger transposable element-derived protein 4-like [Acyrthosiphon pisum]|eukprot:XP_008189021.1 PREDICTED: tigger transposable element-derived protein 4-like [Acyrthosiphon pisum]
MSHDLENAVDLRSWQLQTRFITQAHSRKVYVSKMTEQELKMLHKQEPGIRVLAEKFQVGKTQIADIVSNTEEIYKAWVENGNEERKLTKLRKCEGSVIDKELLVWFSKTREKNLPVSGPTIQEKAKQLAEVHGLNDFKASNGWLEKFRKRHNISFKSICGEASSVDRIAVDDWKKKLPNIIDKYEKRDIFNADETELFFRVLPNKTMAFKNETCNGGKVSKERLTVLLCCNIIGEFERPLIIGKAKRPRAFKKLDVNKFPVDWCWNKKAWMTTQIMTDWLMKFDKQMIKSQRKVLLFVDNAAPHPHLKLKNVELVFFPPNMTSHCQPLDQGIIQQFKKLYRKQLLQKAVADLDAGESSAINVLDAVHQVDEQLEQTIDTGEQSVIDRELLALITLIDSSVEVETYFELDKIISTHDTNLTGTDDPDEPDEPENKEEDEPAEAETSKYQITSLQDVLSAVKSVHY